MERPVPRMITDAIASPTSFISSTQGNSFSCPYFVRVHLPARPDWFTATTLCFNRSFRWYPTQLWLSPAFSLISGMLFFPFSMITIILVLHTSPLLTSLIPDTYALG